jgi:hypothetical protein
MAVKFEYPLEITSFSPPLSKTDLFLVKIPLQFSQL